MSEFLPPLRITNSSGNVNVLPVFNITLSDNLNVVRRGPTGVALTVNTGGGGGTSFTIPLIAGSGGTGQTSLTNRGILIGSGVNPVQSLSALNSGELIVGSSTAVAPQILGAGSQGTYLVSDSSQRLGVAWIGTSNTFLATVTNTTTVTNVTAETTLLGGIYGSTSLGANFIRLARAFRMTAKGLYGTDAVAGGTLNLRVKVGSAVVLTTGDQTVPIGVTNLSWSINAPFVCQTTGGTGTMFGESEWSHETSTLSNPIFWEMTGGAITVDTTIANGVDLTAQWSIASLNHTISCTTFTLEALN